MKFVNFIFYFGMKETEQKNNSRKKRRRSVVCSLGLKFQFWNVKTSCSSSFLSHRSVSQPEACIEQKNRFCDLNAGNVHLNGEFNNNCFYNVLFSVFFFFFSIKVTILKKKFPNLQLFT